MDFLLETSKRAKAVPWVSARNPPDSTEIPSAAGHPASDGNPAGTVLVLRKGPARWESRPPSTFTWMAIRHYGCTIAGVDHPEVSMRRLVCIFVALLAFSSARADALTIRDVVELTRAGLGDEVLLALIEVDPSVFPIDTETLKYLKEAGVSQRVIVAMVRSARTPPRRAPDQFITQVAPQAPEPQVVVIDPAKASRSGKSRSRCPSTYPSCSVRGIRRHVDRDDRVPETEDRRDRADSSKRTMIRSGRRRFTGARRGRCVPDAWKPR